LVIPLNTESPCEPACTLRVILENDFFIVFNLCIKIWNQFIGLDNSVVLMAIWLSITRYAFCL
jgi:hypothetical protein